MAAVSVELAVRVRAPPSAACPNWRRRVPTAANANPSGESTGGSGPSVANDPTTPAGQHDFAHRPRERWFFAGSRDSLSNGISLWRWVLRGGDRRDGLLRGRFNATSTTVREARRVAAMTVPRPPQPARLAVAFGSADGWSTAADWACDDTRRAASRCLRHGRRRLGVPRRRVRAEFRQGRIIGGQPGGHIAVCRGLAVRLCRRVRATAGIHHPRWHLPHRRAPRRRGARLRSVHRTRPRRGDALVSMPRQSMCPRVQPWFDCSRPVLPVPVAPAAPVDPSGLTDSDHRRPTPPLDCSPPQHRHPTRPPTHRRGPQNAQPSRQPPRALSNLQTDPDAPGAHIPPALAPAGGRCLGMRSALLSLWEPWLACRGTSSVVPYCNFADLVAALLRVVEPPRAPCRPTTLPTGHQIPPHYCAACAS